MYENLKKAVIKEIEERFEVVKNSTKEDERRLNYYLTPLKRNQVSSGEYSKEKAIEFVLKKLDKNMKEVIKNKLDTIKEIEEANDFSGCTVSLEWKHSATWGSNPTATLSGCGYIKGSPVSGCGFDKESTAVANILNQCLPLKKKLYDLKELNIELSNHDLFGYGSGYGILPYFDGGVGVSCYCSICEKIGFKFVSVASGKIFDVYEIRKGE